MREKSKFAVLVSVNVALLIMILGMQIPDAAALREAGVGVGDWATYYLESEGHGVDFENFTASFTTTVMAVSGDGKNVTFEARCDYLNGTVETVTLLIDVDSGKGDGSMWFIAANLNPGELVYTQPDPDSNFWGVTINETKQEEYLGVLSQVNHVNLTGQDPPSPTLNTSWTQNYYWFRDTGRLTEFSLNVTIKTQASTYWGRIYALITVIVPEFPTTHIIPLVLIIPLISLLISKALLRPRRLKHEHA
jgi:hypothetical protein